MLSTLGASWKRQCKAEGKLEMLIRQMRRRFGSLAPEVEARVQAGDGARLDDWSERILDAQTLGAVFANDQPH